MSTPTPTTPATQPLTQEQIVEAMYLDPSYGFKRPFQFSKAVTCTVTVTIEDTEKGGKYLRALYVDEEGSELVMPYNLSLKGVQYNRDFFNKVLRVNAPSHMKDHTIKSEKMLEFMPRLLETVGSVTFSVVAVAKYNREKESKRVWIFDTMSSAEEYLETRKQKSKGVPVPVKETKESQERKDVQSSALNSLL